MPADLPDSRNYSHTIRQEFGGVVIFVGIIWGVFFLSRIDALDLNQLALIPRYVTRLPGILAMPFLHADLGHILGNTIPLIVLLTLLAGSRARSSAIVLSLVLISGSILWLVGRNGTPEAPQAHEGASMLVFGLVTFLIGSGILERRLVPLLVSLLVGFLYGGMVLWEVSLLGPLFSHDPRVSWDGHLVGALTGVLVAFWWTGQSPAVWISSAQRVGKPYG